MTLPILTTQNYELTLPSTDRQVKFRPFLVKEEKVLLQALESEDTKQLVTAIKDIVSACTYGELNVDEMPLFDLEYIFLQIRTKSVGETAKVKLLCSDDKETYADVEIDLTKVEVHVEDDHDNNILIDENRKLGMIMKYPTINSIDHTMDVTGLKTKQLFDMIGNTIYQIYEGDKTYMAKDYGKNDLQQFIEALDSKTFDKITKFYQTMPVLKHTVEFENPKTKVKNSITLQGIQDFFALPSHMRA